ncbi:PIN domain-containing protein [Nevskia sp.]|uniref:PIN domain-containing protein n=1 Tax=Nevskia sp. TaxID=1929292 RepID=UPI0025D6F9F4|nr:PIN domain-containing protein [Nevskia sp.]
MSGAAPVARGWLLDTSVLSECAPGKPAVARAVADWLQREKDRLFIPCIAIAEIEQGICKLRRAGSSARVDHLSRWLDGLIADHADSLLTLDVKCSRTLGKISDAALAGGYHPGVSDVAIAAIAAHHDLIVLTRNLRHFEKLPVTAMDPFIELPN